METITQNIFMHALTSINEVTGYSRSLTVKDEFVQSRIPLKLLSLIIIKPSSPRLHLLMSRTALEPLEGDS